MSRRLVLTTMIALWLVIILGACEPTTPPPTTLPPSSTPTTAPSPPQPATPERIIYGASISWQTAGYAQNDGRTWIARPGQGLENMWHEVNAKLAENPTTVFLADISTNSAGTWDGRDGWSIDDEWYWWQTMVRRVPGTCVVIVLPHLEAPAGAANLAQVEVAREWFVRAANMRGAGFVIADWRVWAGAGAIGPDGIHLVGGIEAADRWLGMLDDAETRCTTG